MKRFFPIILNKIVTSESELLKIMYEDLSNSHPNLFTYFNQHSFNIYYNSIEYRRLVDNHFIVYLDGFGIFYALKLLGIKTLNKFNASDINENILTYLAKNKLGVYFIGANFNDDLFNQIITNKGIISLGYKNGYDNIEDEHILINQIKEANPNIIVIGLGSPKQELLAYKISRVTPKTIIICVGNFLEFYFGTKKRAPLFLRNSGFEWLFRLFTEPKRLWKRYIFGIPLFFYRILRIYFQKNQSYEDVS